MYKEIAPVKTMHKLVLLSLFFCCTACSTSQNSPVSTITPQQIMRDVSWLASDQMQGRHYRSMEARKAAPSIADALKQSGLTHLATKPSMYLPTGDVRDAPNVAAMHNGTG
ncbi:MAG: hypothetical protein ACKVIO_07525, partial [Phycisphaerales bacterium]